MKILIVSDTHRRDENFVRVMEREPNVEMVLHLGDVEGSEFYLREVAGCPMEIVSGNNDFFSDLPKEREIEIAGRKVFLTHGHNYYVTVGIEHIRQEGRERGMDIVMFGHTHYPLIDVEKDITLINPGSLSYPRQDGKRPTYIVMTVDAKNEISYKLKYV